MKANVIKNYRQIRNWENFFLDSAIYSVGHSVGIEYESGFQPVAAVTGDLFAYMYSDEKPCDSGLTNYFFDPEAVARAYAMFGFSCVYLSHEEINADLDAALAKIRASVDRGVPALAWGCGGVEMGNGEKYDFISEGCLIGGYDEGDLLYINLYCGKERLAEVSACGKPGVDEYGYTAIPAAAALSTTYGVFILGEKIAQPDMRSVYRDTLFSIPRLLALPPAGGWYFGRQAFERWAEVLREEEFWRDAAMSEANCWDKHCSAYCALCTSIGVGDGDGIVGFVRRMVDALPDVPEASAVLPLFVRLRELNQAVWDVQGGFMPSSDRLVEQEYRERLAAILLEMGGVCDEISAVFI